MLERLPPTRSRGRPFTQVLTDIADILLVAYIAYPRAARPRARNARAMQMGIAPPGVLGVVYFVSKWAEFETLLYLLNALPAILIVVVVFQTSVAG